MEILGSDVIRPRYDTRKNGYKKEVTDPTDLS